MWGWLKWLNPLNWFSALSLEDQVEIVQRTTREACGYLPAAAAVMAMLTAPNPVYVGVVAVAKAICSAVTSRYQPIGFMHHCMEVNGVCIEGEFVDP